MATEPKRETDKDGTNGRGPAGSYRSLVPPGVSHKPAVVIPPHPPKPALTAWQRVQIARHPDRPHTLDYIQRLCTDFIEMHGDRLFGDDAAIIGGLASFDGQTVMVIGQQKGRSTKENITRNFGMPQPEGYRKAQRLMLHAARFGFPILTFIDTPGASPGVQSEERGIGQAIASNLVTMLEIRVPIICTVIGEGGSGGALAIGVGDRILMLENSIYSVASPEAAAAILWSDSAQASAAAETMRITAPDLIDLGVADDIIGEPEGGAHNDANASVDAAGEAIARHLAQLRSQFNLDDASDASKGARALLEARRAKYRLLGAYSEP